MNCEKIRPEWVIELAGIVNKRPQGMENDKILTGQIEIIVKKLTILAEANVLPFDLSTDGKEIKESLRLKYRYLDLRRERLLKNISHRSLVNNFIRNYLLKRFY